MGEGLRGEVVLHATGREEPVKIIRYALRHLLEEGRVDGVVTGRLAEGECKPSLAVSSSLEEAASAPVAQIILYGYKKLGSAPKTLVERAGERLAVLVKPCEARAIVELAKRRKVNLDDVYVIGFDCPGMRREEAHPPEELGRTLSDPPSREELRDACRRCEVHSPPYADVVFSFLTKSGVPIVEARTEKGAALVMHLRSRGLVAGEPALEDVLEREEAIRRLDEEGGRWLVEERERWLSAPEEERLSWFNSQLNLCVKCGSCIRACPLCFCKDCILLSRRREYTPSLFIATRMLHMADLCVGCGKCDEVCPKSIPLSFMFYHVGRMFTSRYGYTPGADFSKPPRIV